MIDLVYSLPDMKATENLAGRLAPCLKRGDILALQGPLGAGKTAFARALLHTLGVRGDVPSPTFTLMQNYDLPAFTLHHFDLYRLKSEDELDELGWDEALADGVSLIEWPERCAGRLPSEVLLLQFTIDDANNRICTLRPQGDWGKRLQAAP